MWSTSSAGTVCDGGHDGSSVLGYAESDPEGNLMSEPRSPLQQVLDLVVFAPLGLAVTVVEDFPDLAEKGRTRLQQRATTARIVGQFAVTAGRRRLQSQGRPAAPSPAPFPGPVPANGMGGTDGGPFKPADGATGPGVTSPGVNGPDGPGPGESSPGAAGPGVSGPLGPVTGGSPPAPPVIHAPVAAPSPGPISSPAPRAARGRPVPAPAPAPPSDSLAIPGYDSLSASQVVQRLASLSGPELAAVRDYEAATRGRRTILARVSQLQS
jgi:hypothetical protein